MRFESSSVALVTGAASGIGAASVRRLASDGVGHFVLVDVKEAELSALRDELGIDALIAAHSVVDEAGWEKTEAAIAARYGQIDVAVVNAGVASGGPIASLDFAEWRRVLSINLDGAFLTMRAALRLLRDGGAIVAVSSISGLKAEPGVAAYAASKAGLTQLVKVAAKEAAPRRIRVNALMPGGVETPIWRGVPFFEALVAEQGGERAAFDAMAAQGVPLGRYARGDEIAAQISWLLSGEAAIITGAALAADGGYSL